MFSAFEFEAAAELFVQLSRSILNDELYSTLCLLNAAIIYARLGDLSRALQHLSEVEEVEELLPITLCLTGHVEYELGNFEKSHDCFSIALQTLDEPQSFDHLGLDFALREEQIQLNLDVLAIRSGLGMMGTIPADVLFESPPRRDTSVCESCCEDGRWSIHSVATSRVSSTRTIAPLRPKRPHNDTDVEEVLKCRAMGSSGLHIPLSPKANVSETSNRLADLTTPRKARIAARYAKLRDEGKRVLTRKTKRPPKEQEVAIKPVLRMEDKRRPRLEARDARPGATRDEDLSRFIQHLPKQSKLIPRDARGRPGSISNLAQFFRGTDPIHARAPVSLRVSVESPIDAEVFRSAGQRDTIPPTAQDNIASTQRDRVPMVERPGSVVGDSTQQPRGQVALETPAAAERPQPQAIHPALRADFSLDTQRVNLRNELKK